VTITNAGSFTDFYAIRLFETFVKNWAKEDIEK
jgi:hypothetical protein